MSSLFPADAEVALRSFPRRWRELLGGLDLADPDTDALLRHRGASGSSALECAGRAASILEVGARNVRSAVVHERPELDDVPEETETVELGAALDRIDAAAPALADTVAGASPGDLDREAVRNHSTVSVRTLVADVVDQVAALLRDAQRSLAEARSRLS